MLLLEVHLTIAPLVQSVHADLPGAVVFDGMERVEGVGENLSVAGGQVFGLGLSLVLEAVDLLHEGVHPFQLGTVKEVGLAVEDRLGETADIHFGPGFGIELSHHERYYFQETRSGQLHERVSLLEMDHFLDQRGYYPLLLVL